MPRQTHGKPAKKTRNKPTGKSVETTGVSTVPPLIPQPHGGALRAGGTPGNAGGGRPPDEIRAKLRNLADGKALPFLSELLEGKIPAYLIGKCEKCQHEQGFDAETVEHLMKLIVASAEHRIKVSEILLKHGLATKELVIANDNAASFFDCISAAIQELYGSEASEAVKARAMVLMEGKK